MNGIRGLFLFKLVDDDYTLVYKKHFTNVEVCAKFVQEAHYVNVFKEKNIEDIIKSQIINKRNENVCNYKEFIELNKTLSCYTLKVKNKIVYPFFFVRRNSFILLTLLLMDDLGSNNDMTIIRGNTNKLLYYNFMHNMLSYIESDANRHLNFVTKKNVTLRSKRMVQKFTNVLDSYIMSVIPYGRFLKESTPFFNYMQRDMYKSGDILDTNFFMFYNFLSLRGRDSAVMGKTGGDLVAQCDMEKAGNGDECGSGDSIDERSDERSGDDCSGDGHMTRNFVREEKKNRNDVLYVNSRPHFVLYKKDHILNDKRKHHFFKLLLQFYYLVKCNQSVKVYNSENFVYSLYLLFFYNYSLYFEKKKKIPIISKYDSNESIKISQENIQTYLPIYPHERNGDTPQSIFIKEELTCLITTDPNENAEIKGEIIMNCSEEKYVDVDMEIELDRNCCDIYVADFANIEKKDKTLKIRYSCKCPSSRVLTYYYRHVACPLFGFYKFRRVNEKQVEINVTLQRNDKMPSIKIEKKTNEYFFLRLPFPGEIASHSLRCNMVTRRHGHTTRHYCAASFILFYFFFFS
ncbi:conserved Plasmodium protein, unknown function [Plasmodium ovale]|uniref:Uncharacterized protein n=1 Tax=Plasmodium ovale TaxID=36330 RepID=A0A1C3KIH6_PLAOA|nr:conserved Plasmodium protein, unknown function [Plasmodium ovale]